MGRGTGGKSNEVCGLVTGISQCGCVACGKGTTVMSRCHAGSCTGPGSTGTLHYVYNCFVNPQVSPDPKCI